MAEKNTFGLIMLALVGLLVAQSFGLIGPQQAGTAGTTVVQGAGGGTTTVKVEGCSGVSGSTMTVKQFDKYAVTTERTTEAYRLFLDGTDMGNKAEGSTTSVAPDQAYTIYASLNTSTASTAPSTVYYGPKKTGVMPCKDLPLQLYVAANGTPTFTYWDLNGAANTAPDLGADDTKSVEIRLQSQSKKAFGNPYLKGTAKNVLCFRYNTSELNSAELSNAESASTPNKVSTDFSASGFTIKCFKFPILENLEEFKEFVVLETTGTAPVTGAGRAIINVTWSDVTYDLNADTGAEIIGVEDEDNNDIGMNYGQAPLPFQ